MGLNELIKNYDRNNGNKQIPSEIKKAMNHYKLAREWQELYFSMRQNDLERVKFITETKNEGNNEVKEYTIDEVKKLYYSDRFLMYGFMEAFSTDKNELKRLIRKSQNSLIASGDIS